MISRVRIVALVALVGIWQAAASVLRAPLVLTALVTLAAAALGGWAVAVLRER